VFVVPVEVGAVGGLFLPEGKGMKVGRCGVVCNGELEGRVVIYRDALADYVNFAGRKMTYVPEDGIVGEVLGDFRAYSPIAVTEMDILCGEWI
jgi:hypothetical protein